MTEVLLRADRDGERLDQFLARSVEGLTRSAAQRLIEEGAVTCNGKAVKKNARTAVGDAVDLTLPDPEPVDVVLLCLWAAVFLTAGRTMFVRKEV